VTNVTGEFNGQDNGKLLAERTVAGMGATGALDDEPDDDEDDDVPAGVPPNVGILLVFFRSLKFLCRT